MRKFKVVAPSMILVPLILIIVKNKSTSLMYNNIKRMRKSFRGNKNKSPKLKKVLN